MWTQLSFFFAILSYAAPVLQHVLSWRRDLHWHTELPRNTPDEWRSALIAAIQRHKLNDLFNKTTEEYTAALIWLKRCKLVCFSIYCRIVSTFCFFIRAKLSDKYLTLLCWAPSASLKEPLGRCTGMSRNNWWLTSKQRKPDESNYCYYTCKWE